MIDPATRQPSGLPRFPGTHVPAPRTERRWLPVAGDIALAVGLLVADVVGVVAAFLLGIDVSGDWKPWSSPSVARGSTPNAPPRPTTVCVPPPPAAGSRPHRRW
ncbi:hypothetical protein [Streptomyces sp. NPDC093591]|uniref:hypothetical protein n=1 Tax=Streptomyces sp. NPDC093591 TaxID=3366044 RepID=UPI003803070B